MARKRLSDTQALASAKPASDPMARNESYNVEVRKIDNGYVKRTSVYRDGDYSSTEVFSREEPSLGITPHSNPGSSSLRDAIKSMK